MASGSENLISSLDVGVVSAAVAAALWKFQASAVKHKCWNSGMWITFTFLSTHKYQLYLISLMKFRCGSAQFEWSALQAFNRPLTVQGQRYHICERRPITNHSTGLVLSQWYCYDHNINTHIMVRVWDPLWYRTYLTTARGSISNFIDTITSWGYTNNSPSASIPFSTFSHILRMSATSPSSQFSTPTYWRVKSRLDHIECLPKLKF